MTNLQNIYKGKRALITGGCGFIGSNLARRLTDLGADVTIVDSLIPNQGGNLFNLTDYENRITFISADIREHAKMNSFVKDKDYLFNLAGQVSHIDSMNNPFNDLGMNVTAQLSILESCKKHNCGIKIFFSSTRQVYGKSYMLPVNESHPTKPLDINGIHKLTAEQYHLLYHEIYQIPVTIMRLTNVYGPRMWIKDKSHSFIGWWIKQVVNGESIKVYGDGNQVRDLNYVNDIVDAILQVMENPIAVGKIYNVGSTPITLLELARMLIELAGKGDIEMVSFPPERKIIDIGSYHSDFSKIQTELNWTPATPLREGLTLTLEYYNNYFNYYI